MHQTALRVSGLGFLCLTAAGLATGDPVDLRPRFQPQQELVYRVVEAVNATFRTEGGPERSAGFRDEMAISIKVRDVAADGTATAEAVFLAPRTEPLTLMVGPNMPPQIIEESEELAPGLTARQYEMEPRYSADAIIKQMPIFATARANSPASPGDAWTDYAEATRPLIGKVAIETRYKLLSVDEPSKTAEIAVTQTLLRIEPASTQPEAEAGSHVVEFYGALSGTAKWDFARGHCASAGLTGKTVQVRQLKAGGTVTLKEAIDLTLERISLAVPKPASQAASTQPAATQPAATTQQVGRVLPAAGLDRGGPSPPDGVSADLRPKFHAGQELFYRLTEAGDNTSRLSDGRNAPRNQHLTFHNEIGFAIKVRGVGPDGGATLELRVAYLRFRFQSSRAVFERDTRAPETFKQGEPGPGPEFLQIVNWPITILVDAEGKVQRVEGADNLLAALGDGRLRMEPWLSADALRRLPLFVAAGANVPAAVGHVWQDHFETGRYGAGPSGAMAVDTTYTLSKIDEGARTAEIAIVHVPTLKETLAAQTQPEQKRPAPEFTADWKGTVRWDLAAGQCASASTTFNGSEKRRFFGNIEMNAQWNITTTFERVDRAAMERKESGPSLPAPVASAPAAAAVQRR